MLANARDEHDNESSCKDKPDLLASNQESGDVPSAIDASPNGDVLWIKSRPICGCQGSEFRCGPTRVKYGVVSVIVIHNEERGDAEA